MLIVGSKRSGVKEKTQHLYNIKKYHTTYSKNNIYRHPPVDDRPPTQSQPSNIFGSDEVVFIIDREDCIDAIINAKQKIIHGTEAEYGITIHSG
ncbi:hypothetical protein [Enterobacter asburiae]|uniref:hypothetical protein n=1 Tax=Enterobacter asburiae TaxID=61645 RepID=UPI0013010642|nr:hypothetical protein [Enterobacter asburiae]